MRWIVLLLLGAACGGSEMGPATVERWAGTIQTPDGSYGAFLVLTDQADGGGFEAEARGLTGTAVGVLPDLVITPTGCDAGFTARAVVRGDALDFSYSGASCADAPSGSGILKVWR